MDERTKPIDYVRMAPIVRFLAQVKRGVVRAVQALKRN